MAKKTSDDFLAQAKQMCGFLDSEKDDMEWEDFSSFCDREILAPLASALKLDPGFAKAHLLKAKVLLCLGAYEEGLEVANQLVKTEPTNPDYQKLQTELQKRYKRELPEETWQKMVGRWL